MNRQENLLIDRILMDYMSFAHQEVIKLDLFVLMASNLKS